MIRRAGAANRGVAAAESHVVPMTFSLHGIGISGGYAIGRAQLYSHDRLEAPHYVLRARATSRPRWPLRRSAIDERARRMLPLREPYPEGAPPELAAFLDLHG
jgi:phosphoenolpyruvate-protein phosphotransferase (PTS system enzyme I)